METLSNNWAEIQPDKIYQTTNDRLVSFSKEQIQLGIKYDQNNKHLKPIEKGGDRRFHGIIIDGVLHFPGLATEH